MRSCETTAPPRRSSATTLGAQGLSQKTPKCRSCNTKSESKSGQTKRND